MITKKDYTAEFNNELDSFNAKYYKAIPDKNPNSLCQAFKKAIKSSKSIEDKKALTEEMVKALINAASSFNNNNQDLKETIDSVNKISSTIRATVKPELIPQSIKLQKESADYYIAMCHVKYKNGNSEYSKKQISALDTAVNKITSPKKWFFSR